MTPPKNAFRDRRIVSRDKIILSCLLIFEGKEHSALITDISLGGAYLQCDFLPPVGSDVSIKTEASLVGVQLILEAKVLRYDLKKFGRRKARGFGIQFRNSSPELEEFIIAYAKPRIK